MEAGREAKPSLCGARWSSVPRDCVVTARTPRAASRDRRAAAGARGPGGRLRGDGCAHSPVLLWMVLTVVVVRGGEEDRRDTHSSSCEQPFSMART